MSKIQYLIPTILCALMLAGCGLTQVKASGDAKIVNNAKHQNSTPPKGDRKTLVLFGGVGYIDDSAQEYLYGLLTDQSYRLEDDTETFVNTLNQEQGGFQNLSAYPIALYTEDVETAVTRVLNVQETPWDAAANLHQYFDQVLGLFFIGSYEQHMGISYTYPLSDGGEQTAFHDYFFTSVSAVLFDMKTDKILLSASALGHEKRQATAAPVKTHKEKEQYFLQAYAHASKAALERLAGLLHTRNPTQIRAENKHMVTGVWVNGSNAQHQFQWKHPGQSQDMCQVPSGCADGSIACAQFSSLLAHGITDALAKKGLITLPPLNWSQWRSDNAWEVSARFSLPENRASLTDRLIDFSLDPSQVTHKYVAAVDDVEFIRSPNPKNPFWVTDHYISNLGLIRARTLPGSCHPEQGIEIIDSKNFYGTYESQHTSNQPEATAEQQRMFYLIALMNALENLPKEAR